MSLAKARKRRDQARELLADGIDPGVAKRQEKQAKVSTFIFRDGLLGLLVQAP